LDNKEENKAENKGAISLNGNNNNWAAARKCDFFDLQNFEFILSIKYTTNA
jgi:hypothetical protein